MKKKITIAIDGPSASGKSSTAKLLAKKLNYIYIDTGAMYRAVTLWCLENGKPDNKEFNKQIKSINVSIVYENSVQKTLLNRRDVSKEIRSLDVTANVSQVASMPSVREYLVNIQKRMGENGGVVLDGRDIGTVVFPDAELKIFLVASSRSRAERRLKEVREGGEVASLEEIEQDLIQRDKLDSSREHSPLRKAGDAIELDTSNLTLESQVDKIYEYARLITESRQRKNEN